MSKVIIETPRLIIREFNLDDLEAVFEFSINEDVTRYTGDAGAIKTREDAKGVIESIWLAEYKKYGYARWALQHKQSGKVIGFCGFKNDDRIQATDLGYRMLPEFWGQGLATEACTACLQYAKQHMALDRILGEVVVQNTNSANVLEKLGFKFVSEYPDLGVTIKRYELWLNSIR